QRIGVPAGRVERHPLPNVLVPCPTILGGEVGAVERSEGSTVLQVDADSAHKDTGARLMGYRDDVAEVALEVLVYPCHGRDIGRNLLLKKRLHPAPLSRCARPKGASEELSQPHGLEEDAGPDEGEARTEWAQRRACAV